MRRYEVMLKVEEKYEVEANSMKEALLKTENPHTVTVLSGKAKLIKESSHEVSL